MIGCIPWLNPIIAITISVVYEVIIPNAPIAKSPPYLSSVLFIRIFTNEVLTLSKKGDNPIDSIAEIEGISILNVLLEKCSMRFFLK